MPILQHTIPTFNLKAVVQETSLKPDTLRAWERRYGLPLPERSSGGHRLYSQRDIDTIKWLIARQDEGLTISRAVELWGQLEDGGQDPLRAIPLALPRAVNDFEAGATGDNPERLTQAWVAACLAFDELRAEQILSQAFALYPVETVCLELLFKGLAQIGQSWADGEVTVQQEHFASELALRRLEALVIASPSPTRPGRILIACPPEEEHVLAPLMLTLFLRRRGRDVLYLSANTPLMRLEKTIVSIKPELVILVAQQLPTAATLLEVSELLQVENVSLAFGGSIFNRVPELRAYIPGHFVGENIEQATSQLEWWLTSLERLQPVSAAKTANKIHQQALAHYREKSGLIEAEVWHSMKKVGLAPRYLVNANKGMARNLTAGLIFGNLDYASFEIIRGEICHFPAEVIPRYLCFYTEAAKIHLDERGQPIITWLEGLVKKL